MTNTEKIKAVIEMARRFKYHDRTDANICATVIITGNSLLETLDCYYGASEFIKGVIYGKASFFNQITLMMLYHFEIYETAKYDYSIDELVRERLEQKEGEKSA